MYGHFAVCCRNLNRTAPEMGRGLCPKSASGYRKAFRRQTNQVEDYVAGSSQEEESPAFAFIRMEENEEGVCEVSTARHILTMNVSIDAIVQEVLIDSGSVSNLMGEDDLGNAKVVSNFVIVKCGSCILGNTAAKELGVLHIGPKASQIGGSCNEVKSNFANQLKAQYPKVFTGVGKLKDFNSLS